MPSTRLILLCLLGGLGGRQVLSAQAPACPRTNPVNVTSATTTGQTLGWAIGCLNSVATLTQIQVTLPAGTLVRISPNAPLPPIRRANAVLNGNDIILDGAQVTSNNGITIEAANVNVNNLVIRSFTASAGIRLSSGTGATITNNTLISNQYGVFIARSVPGATITNNAIGTNGAAAAGNTAAGVFAEAFAGATAPPPNGGININNNTIANSPVGVSMVNTRSVTISRNSIYCNTTEGISRSATPAAPVITRAALPLITGTGSAGATIEVFVSSNSGCQTTVCQGRTYLGSTTVGTNGGWTFSTTAVKAGQLLTATQTLSTGNTSEFSSCSTAIDVCANFGASISGTNPLCNGNLTGRASVTVVGGATPVRISWSNGASGATLNDLRPGTYSATVTDGNNCQQTLSTTITEPPVLRLQLTPTDLSRPGAADGRVSSSVSGGTPPYRYSWDSGPNTANISGLVAGDYTLKLTDANGCNVTATATVGAGACANFRLSATRLKRACPGLNDGQLSASASGGTGTVTYLWSNRQSGATQSNLAPGNYSVTATDAQGCAATASVALTAASALVLRRDSVNPQCAGNRDAKIGIAVSGGTAPYNYLWGGGERSSGLELIPSGTYTVVVTDSNRCEAKTSFTLSDPPALAAVLNPFNETGPGRRDGRISTTASGGTPPYRYLWSNGATTADLNNLAPGEYRLTLSDANGCTLNVGTQLGGAPCGNFAVTTRWTKRACPGLNDGQALASASGASGALSYRWSNGQSGPSLTNVAAGLYQVTASDATGCSGNASVVVPAALAMAVRFSASSPRCNGGTDGKIDAALSGGTPPLRYRWSNGSSASALEQVPAGLYALTVTDSSTCNLVADFTLLEPPALSLSLTPRNESGPARRDGAITSSAGGGTPPYRYLWSNGATSANLSALAAGDYTLSLSDSQGCTLVRSVRVNGLDCRDLSISASATRGSCRGSSSGAAQATPRGGQAPLQVVWSNGRSGNQLDGLAPGTYQVSVSDARGCSATASVQVPSQGRAPLPAYGLIGPDSVCAGAPLTLSVDDLWPSPQVRYYWELPSGDTLVTRGRELKIAAATPAAAGDYFVSRDSGGCISPAFGPVILTVVALPGGADAAGRDTAFCNATVLPLQASATGGSNGRWLSLDGARLADPLARRTSVSDLRPGANRFVWTVDLGKCTGLGVDTVNLFWEQAPVLQDDAYQIARVQDVAAMNVLLNDAVAGVRALALTVPDPPSIGRLEAVAGTNSFRYTAPDDFRGVVQFRYVVCNTAASCATPCDTARVQVDVFNLPTPTDGLILGDPGPNGQLLIRGLNGFSQVSISIFSRWGDLVYQNDNYDNGAPWRGERGTGAGQLPPGAYYYVLRAYDTGAPVGGPQTGVLHLFLPKNN